VEFRSVFRAPSRKFKILAIPNILAHGKSYEHGFMKKCDGHKLCAMSYGKSYEHSYAKKYDSHKLSAKSSTKSSFDQFFVHRLGNSKHCPFERINPWDVVRARFWKNIRRS
ncbi:hypothetical protein BHE74_00031047, partial [Ensete ventricosum]